MAIASAGRVSDRLVLTQGTPTLSSVRAANLPDTKTLTVSCEHEVHSRIELEDIPNSGIHYSLEWPVLARAYFCIAFPNLCVSYFDVH